MNSRHLQTRALRKLSMLLRRVRIGLGFEEEAMVELGIPNTPLPFTPVPIPRTPAHVPHIPEVPQQVLQDDGAEVLQRASNEMNALEDTASIKEEFIDEVAAQEAAVQIDVVCSRAIQIDSSPGSESSSYSSDGSDSDSSQPLAAVSTKVVFSEQVPADKDFYRHVRSGILHCCKLGGAVSSCQVPMGKNFKIVSRVFNVRYPKCMKCFSKTHNRIRNLDGLNAALESSLKRLKNS